MEANDEAYRLMVQREAAKLFASENQAAITQEYDAGRRVESGDQMGVDLTGAEVAAVSGDQAFLTGPDGQTRPYTVDQLRSLARFPVALDALRAIRAERQNTWEATAGDAMVPTSELTLDSADATPAPETPVTQPETADLGGVDSDHLAGITNNGDGKITLWDENNHGFSGTRDEVVARFGGKGNFDAIYQDYLTNNNPDNFPPPLTERPTWNELMRTSQERSEQMGQEIKAKLDQEVQKTRDFTSYLHREFPSFFPPGDYDPLDIDLPLVDRIMKRANALQKEQILEYMPPDLREYYQSPEYRRDQRAGGPGTLRLRPGPPPGATRAAGAVPGPQLLRREQRDPRDGLPDHSHGLPDHPLRPDRARPHPDPDSLAVPAGRGADRCPRSRHRKADPLSGCASCVRQTQGYALFESGDLSKVVRKALSCGIS